MNHSLWITSLALFLLVASAALAAEDAAEDATKAAADGGRIYELRVYTAAPGKLDALHARFRDHTRRLFEKHGMENVGYWVPLDNPDQKLYYLLSFPSAKERRKAWAGFMADPDWRQAWAESEKEGRLVTKVESTLLSPTDYSPPIKPSAAKEPRVFELRTYTATPGNLVRLNARFRDHTIALFTKHGMEHIGYWVPEPDQKHASADNTLIYLLAHKSKEACAASFQSFRDDPDWKSARAASEKAAGGSLTTEGGVKSLLLAPTDYSPTK